MSAYTQSHVGVEEVSRYRRYITKGLPGRLWSKVEKPLLAVLVDEYLPDSDLPIVVDLACGWGRASSAIGNRLALKLACDVSLEQMKIADPGVACFVGASATELPFADATIDAVVSLRFFANSEDHLRSESFRELHRVLKPDGIVLFNLHNLPRTVPNVARQLFRMVRGREFPRYVRLSSISSLIVESDFECLERIPYNSLGAYRGGGFSSRLAAAVCGYQMIVARACPVP